MENFRLKTLQEKVCSKDREGLKPRFLFQLFDLLELENFDHLISWSPDGKSIIIKNKQQVAEQVLPNLFNHKNFSSFVRQLHMYKFRRVRNSEQFYSYSNPNFKKGQRDLLDTISRRKSSHAATEMPTQVLSDQEIIAQLGIENGCMKVQLREAEIQIGCLQARNKSLENMLKRFLAKTSPPQYRQISAAYRGCPENQSPGSFNHSPNYNPKSIFSKEPLQNQEQIPLPESNWNQNTNQEFNLSRLNRLPPLMEEDEQLGHQLEVAFGSRFQNPKMRNTFSNHHESSYLLNPNKSSYDVNDLFDEQLVNNTSADLSQPTAPESLNQLFQGQSRMPF